MLKRVKISTDFFPQMVTHYFPLCELPDTVLEQTLRMVSYHEISQLRRVNKKFNTMCMALLNKGFRSTEKYCRQYFQVIDCIHIKKKLLRNTFKREGGSHTGLWSIES